MPSEQEMQQQKTGAVESPRDYRYVNLEHLAGAVPDITALPPSFHIDYSGIPDLFQNKIGACTAHAFTNVRMHRELRLTGAVKNFSPRFVYAMSKIEDGIPGEDNGSFPVMPFKIGVKYGIPTEALIPNDASTDFETYVFHRDVQTMPVGTFEEAAQNKIPGYVQVGAFNNITEAQLKQGIMQSLDGLTITLPVGSEWWTAVDGTVTWDKALLLPIRKMVTRVSGHDVTATGWEVESGSGRVKTFFRNQWSTAWADNDNGWFYLDQHMISEAWMASEIPDPILAIVKSLPKKSEFVPEFVPGLKVGSRGPDVTTLQIGLKIVGTFPFNQAVTDYFGGITQKAVMDFQTEYKVASPAQITAANGEAGPKTCAVLNKIIKESK